MAYVAIILSVAVALNVWKFQVCLGQSESPIVTIESGQIRGKRNFTVEGNNSYYAFQGIPYAEPPIGNLRFAAPVKISNWTGIINATEDGNLCVQGTDPIMGDEDCLSINVYTRNLDDANRSVIVWVYGGGFTGGFSTYAESGPDYLLDQNIVYVSFNYRVGIFGFISTEDIVNPGNWGLKDQILALEWVQNNIEYFGGNASDVTIMGQSAGASSISYLLQTNKTEGLFSKVILQSGSSLCLWGLNRRARRTAFSIGLSLGIVTSNSTYLVAKLREIDYQTLQSTASSVSTLITLENALQGIMFGPVIEPEHDGAVVVNNSDELFLQGKFHGKPILLGVTSNEAAAIGALPDILRLYLTTYSRADLAPYDINSNYFTRLAAGFVVKFKYFGIGLVSLSNSNNIIKFISDDQWNRPMRRLAQSLSRYVPVYFYKFSYEGNLFGVSNRNFSGVGHTEDLGYLFQRDVLPLSNITETDLIVRSRMVKLWTNFAKYGNPTPSQDPLLQNITWKTAGTDPKNITYLNINVTLSLQQNPFAEEMEFYDDLYEEFGSRPYDTY